MGRAAKVTSIDAVDAMTVAMERFAEDADAALSDLELELRRALDWIQHDRKTYWAQEVRNGWDRVARARQELERHRVLHKVADHEPGCREEKKALAEAKRRLHVAQEKVEAVRRWTHAVAKEVNEYRGSVNQLASWLQADLPRAVASLHRMSGALDSYVRLQSTAETLTPELPGAASRDQGLETAGQPVGCVKRTSHPPEPPAQPVGEPEEPQQSPEQPTEGDSPRPEPGTKEDHAAEKP